MARYAKEVVICYDSDDAGRRATARAIPILRDAGLLVKVLAVPGNKDPDEYIRSHGAEGHAYFKRLLDACGNDVEYRLGRIKAECSTETPQGRVEYLTRGAELLSTLENRIEQEVYAGRLAQETGIDRGAVLSQVRKYSRRREKNRSQKQFRQVQRELGAVGDTVNPEKSRHLRAANAEEALIAYLAAHPDGAEWGGKAPSAGKIQHQFYPEALPHGAGKTERQQASGVVGPEPRPDGGRGVRCFRDFGPASFGAGRAAGRGGIYRDHRTGSGQAQ